jgi:hypothetical protein
MPQLAPKYIPRGYFSVPERTKATPLYYARRNNEFVLRFRYHGIGLTACSYESSERVWECGVGFY